jgi:bifunctional oligoribonuclease and PAP phosphatase NrnA
VNELSAAVDFLRRTDKLIITAHDTPDGDALGSECAIRRALLGMGKKAIILNADPTPRKFAFLDPDNAICVLQDEAQVPVDVETYGLLMLDTNDIHNIGCTATLVLPRVREYFIVDHHENEEDVLTGNLILKSASSTAEIVYQILREMGIEIDLPMAEALYTGIIYDTGCFIYPKTTAITFDIARHLVQCGVQPNAVYTRVYESNSISALLLQSRVLSTLELAHANHVALLTMSREMIRDSGANYEEADGIINIPLRSEDVRVSIFFKENTDGLLRCSLRSKGAINVAEIAQTFGGGGHQTAAGFKCRLSMEKTKRAILERLRVHFL